MASQFLNWRGDGPAIFEFARGLYLHYFEFIVAVSKEFLFVAKSTIATFWSIPPDI